METNTIEARHTTKTEVSHKVVFWIDGKKYGFRCSEELLDRLQVDEGAVIPELDYDWTTNYLRFTQG